MTTRAKSQGRELQCLFAVAEILVRRDLTLDEVCRRVLEELPRGFQHPEIARCRIRLGDVVYESEGFEETPWVLRAHLVVRGKLAGSLDLAYLENRSLYGESPFLLDERKLVEITALKLGACAELREPRAPAGEPREQAQPARPEEHRPEWRAILELVQETDPALHKRLLRRLMNHLTKLGVPGVQELILQFDPAIYAQREADSRGANQPLPKRDLSLLERAFQEILRVASIALDESELAVLLKQWIRQDKLGFFALAIEKRDISLVEITEIVNRFCRDTKEEEQALSRADDINVRVALTRRFLTESLPFIQVAKECFSVHDFGRILQRVLGPGQGNGRLGGKAAGLLLAAQILKRRAKGNPLLERIRIPHTWFAASDGLLDFVHYNSLEDLQSFKFSTIEEVRHSYPYIEQVFKHSFFSPEMLNQLKVALDDLGDGPLIVRSSSLLEDSEGSAFSGKYRSLFLPNTGTREERLGALTDAIAEVYASIFGPDPIQYRTERGLLDFMEEMGFIIQRVVGQRVGKYFFPAFAGVAFSNNEFRWSPRIRREDGILRIVAGLGTRAVDRVGDDFPVLVSPGRPELRVNVTPEQVIHYAQKSIDVLNLESGRFESPPIEQVFREVGDQFPMLDKVVSVFDGSSLRRPMLTTLDPSKDDLVVTFAGLVETTDFVRQMREVLRILQDTIGRPVDLEFAHDGEALHLLQCRPQSRLGEDAPAPIPHWIPEKRKLFSANRYVTNGQVSGIAYIVHVDPEEYNKLPSQNEMVQVANAISRLNAALPRRSFILMGPGRWGSRGDITLGVGVTYSGINNTLMLIEIARRKGSYVPDLSFGTHFFQDLVEAKIRYLALFPDEDGVIFNKSFFRNAPNLLSSLVPEYAHLQHVVKVIDVAQASGGLEARVVMDGEKDQALGFLLEKNAPL
jgi:pyruvate,water dikinase